MPDRRMFSKRIVESTRFLKLPKAAQNLYFHLGMWADDDGIVEANQVILWVKSDKKYLTLLEKNNFIKIFNDDFISFIIDWDENNHIRADRRKASVYGDLAALARSEYGQQDNNELTTKCQPNDNQMSTKRQPNVRIGKDSIVKDRKEKDKPNGLSKEKSSAPLRNVSLGFAEFYKAYPRHDGRAQAEKAYAKVKVSNDVLLKAIEIQKQSEQWQNPKYIPYPATWLNQRRWEDVMPEDDSASQKGERAKFEDLL